MQTTCPSCGKRTRISAEDADASLICIACGATFDAPTPQLPVHPSEREETSDVAEASSSASNPIVSVRSNVGRKATWIAIGGVGILLAMVFALHPWRARHTSAVHPSPRMNAAQPELIRAVELKSRAESLALTGRLRESVEAYDQLSASLAAENSENPALAALAAQVSSDRQRVQDILGSVPATLSAARSVASISVPRRSQPTTRQTPASAPAASRPAPLAAGIQEPPVYPRENFRPAAQSLSALTDEQIDLSIQKGVNFLTSQFSRKAATVLSAQEPGYAFGADALCVYALLQSGLVIDDPELKVNAPPVKRVLDALKRFNLDERATYSRALRIAALGVFARAEDVPTMRTDVAYLLRSHIDGGYSYNMKDTSKWDNSNSQYGLLGVWSGAEAGVEVPTIYWQTIDRHWTECQLPDGQWSYYSPSGPLPSGGPSFTMTAAGIASLFVTHDYLDPPHFTGDVGREPFSPALKKAMQFWEQGDHSVQPDPTHPTTFRPDGGYGLYGIARVGLASGFKYFGTHNWYRELAAQVIARQAPNGAWQGEFGPAIETAYALLFLSRGRHPILMNKLRFEGYWANRPRDVASLARWSSRQRERQLNWQIVPIDHEWTDWADSPILYLSRHRPFRIGPGQIESLRNFVLAGGLLFTQADGDSPEFNDFVRELAHALFPKYEMQDVPGNHAIYSLLYKVRPRPPLKMVSNGSRILLLHSPTDLSQYWQKRDDKTAERFFQLGLNLFIYSIGNRELRHRIDTPFIAPATRAPVQRVPIARLEYAGDWDPEPYAWTRYARWFEQKTGFALDVKTVRLRDLQPGQTPIAHLTGYARYVPTEEEIAAVRRYVAGGGVLLVDLCGGTGPFDGTMRDELFAKAFPGVAPHLITPGHPLLSAGKEGMEELSKPKLRPFAIDVIGPHAGLPDSIRFGRGHVIYTSLDLISGLLGTSTWGIIGYDSFYSEAFMKNLILWTLDGQPDAFPATQPATSPSTMP